MCEQIEGCCFVVLAVCICLRRDVGQTDYGSMTGGQKEDDMHHCEFFRLKIPRDLIGMDVHAMCKQTNKSNAGASSASKHCVPNHPHVSRGFSVTIH
jgi:hypothetical protein